MMENIWLGNYAQIIRCQVARKAIDLPMKDLQLPGGRYICPEIAMPNLDNDTGLLNTSSAKYVDITFGAENSIYLLKTNDIVMVFNGVYDKLGMCGLTAAIDKPMVTARNLCIIRAIEGKMDPVWLFYYLDSVRDSICQKCAGPPLDMKSEDKIIPRSIRLEELRKVEIRLPSELELAYVAGVHQKTLAEREKLIAANGNIMENRRSIQAVMQMVDRDKNFF